LSFDFTEARKAMEVKTRVSKLPTNINASAVLLTHSRHEEGIISPYIRQIESTHCRKKTYGNLFVRTLRKPLSNIEKEHDVIMSILKEIRSWKQKWKNAPLF
jgi:hypothetical protein